MHRLVPVKARRILSDISGHTRFDLGKEVEMFSVFEPGPDATMTTLDMTEMAQRVANGDRRALARAITVVESTRTDHRDQATALLTRLRAQGRKALRIGLSGTPGVGKSTFIEAFGMMLIAQGLRVAVLAVDPSSARTGGAILGDKTRMPRLSREANAFIRPSPSKSTLGGVAGRTRAVIDLVEGAGFDVVLVETVGVGQSETVVADMTDVFVLLLAPAGGDELQGVKRGIMEHADIVLVNKADGDLQAQAMRTAADYAGALRLLRHPATCPDGFPKAMTVSALTETGLADAWQAMKTLHDWRRDTGVLDRMRAHQMHHALDTAIEEAFRHRLGADPDIVALRARLETDVASGRISAETAAIRLLDQLGLGVSGD